MHPERAERLGPPPNQRCPDCFTPFAPEDVDRERGFAWCVPCRKAMHLPSSASGPPPLGTARLQKTEGGGLRVSWRTRRPLDLLKSTFVHMIGMFAVGGGLFLAALNPYPGLFVAAVTLALGGFAWLQGLRALWRCMEVVQLRVEGRSVIIRDGPFSWRRRPVLDGARVQRLRLIREKVPWVDQSRDQLSPRTMYTLIVELRDGTEQVLARGFMDRPEPMWLALELHRALDLATQVELRT